MPFIWRSRVWVWRETNITKWGFNSKFFEGGYSQCHDQRPTPGVRRGCHGNLWMTDRGKAMLCIFTFSHCVQRAPLTPRQSPTTRPVHPSPSPEINLSYTSCLHFLSCLLTPLPRSRKKMIAWEKSEQMCGRLGEKSHQKKKKKKKIFRASFNPQATVWGIVALTSPSPI